jgi:hypothetical protein
LHSGLITPAVYTSVLAASLLTILANATLVRLFNGPPTASATRSSPAHT